MLGILGYLETEGVVMHWAIRIKGINSVSLMDSIILFILLAYDLGAISMTCVYD